MQTTFIDKNLMVLFLVLIVIGIILTLTTIRGAFIIDEINYMVNVIGLRDGRLTVPGTEGMIPSKELLYFDPEPYDRVVTSTPVVSLAPPLYAPIALPFLFLGWRGLVFLNTLSYLLTAFLIFLFVKRIARTPSTPWLATALFILGGFAVEYAQGVWPHMLTIALCTSAVYTVNFVWEGKRPTLAFLGGVLIGIACGVREQNIFLAGCLGLTLLAWGRNRILSAVLYAGGTALPLAISATLNYFRLGIWYPTPKAVAYSNLVSSQTHSGSLFEPFKVFWVRIVDFSAFEYFRDKSQFFDFSREASTGAFLVAGIVKKALVQSSPWIGLVLLFCVLAWKQMSDIDITIRNKLRALSLLIILPLIMFSMAGFRTDGLSFNQRYLLEIVPFAALVAALWLDRVSLDTMHLVGGFLIGLLAFALTFILPVDRINHIAILRVPLLLLAVLIVAWIMKDRSGFKRILAFSLGLCIGWSCFVQTIDLLTSRRIRSTHAAYLTFLERTIQNHSALFTYWGSQKASAGPIQLDRDVIILDAWADDGHDAHLLARDLLQRNRHVYVPGTGLPPTIIQNIQGDDSLAVVSMEPYLLFELLGKEPPTRSTITPENPRKGAYVAGDTR